VLLHGLVHAIDVVAATALLGAAACGAAYDACAKYKNDGLTAYS